MQPPAEASSEGRVECSAGAVAADAGQGKGGLSAEARAHARLRLATAFGHVVWIKSHKDWPQWPAIVVTPEEADSLDKRRPPRKKPIVVVKCFNTNDWQRVELDQEGLVLGLREGLQAGLHVAPRKPCSGKVDRKTWASRVARLQKAVYELEQYLLTGERPSKMVPPDNDHLALDDSESEAEPEEPAAKRRNSDGSPAPGVAGMKLPMRLGQKLTIEALGRVEYINPMFHNEKHIWPVGFRAVRMLLTPAVAGREAAPHVFEVLASEDGLQPVFRVSYNDTVIGEGDNPRKAWVAVWEGRPPAEIARATATSATTIFGLSNGRVEEAVRQLPGARKCDRYCDWEGEVEPLTAEEKWQRQRVEARLLTTPDSMEPVTPVSGPVVACCDVCGEEEEHDGNLLLDCDCCGASVHMGCYGVSTPPDGGLWLCDTCSLCNPAPPPCALCPVIGGGVMKRTDDGRWCHLLCAMWTPETSIADVTKMEPVQGLRAVSKSRATLRCGVCKQSGGACIQCAGGRHCYTAFHPMCARSAGLQMVALETEECDGDGGEEGQAEGTAPAAESSNARKGKGTTKDRWREGTAAGGGTVLMCFCTRHKPTHLKPSERQIFCPSHRSLFLEAANSSLPAAGAPPATASAAPSGAQAATAPPPPPPPPPMAELWPAAEYGCSRAMPFDAAKRSGRREPDALDKAACKRRYVRLLPYQQLPAHTLQGTYHDPSQPMSSGNRQNPAAAPIPAAKPAPAVSPHHPPWIATTAASLGIRSKDQSYSTLQASVNRRVGLCKSAIQGWGACAKAPLRAGELVLEYQGEVVRGAVGDLREARHYDTLVGAGTYIFHLDGDQLVDATKAGNIAHLLNHSCAPNCISRHFSIGGCEHVIIQAARDIGVGEELTYDYRFSGKQALHCWCGAPTCRGLVNKVPPGTITDDFEDGRLSVPRSALLPVSGAAASGAVQQ